MRKSSTGLCVRSEEVQVAAMFSAKGALIAQAAPDK